MFILDKLADITVNILSAFFIFLITSLFTWGLYNHKLKKDNRSESFPRFFSSLILNKFSYILDKAIMDSKNADNEPQNKEKQFKTIEIVDPKEGQDSDSTKIVTSKNYGEDEHYIIRTWFGINPIDLKNEAYKFICFKITDTGELYFRRNDLLNLLDEEKFKNKRLNIYIEKGKNNNWSITRFGDKLIQEIKIEDPHKYLAKI